MIIVVPSLLPQNLAALGVPRQVQPPLADLETIARTTYPVLARYQSLCKRVRSLRAYGGGTRRRQAHRVPGYILSGYRTEILNDNFTSPHLYAFAIDFIVSHLIDEQLETINAAAELFSRVGWYPKRRFAHADLAPVDWIKRFNKKLYWIENDNGTMVYYTDFSDFSSGVRDYVKNVA